MLILAKKLERQCYVSGDLDGIVREGKAEVVGIVCRVVEKELESEISV